MTEKEHFRLSYFPYSKYLIHELEQELYVQATHLVVFRAYLKSLICFFH